MPYNCHDIEIILKSDDEESADIELFSQHLSICRRCADLCDPGSEIEAMLNATFAPAAPPGIDSEIMRRLSSIDSRPKLVSWLGSHLSYVSASALLAVCAVITLGWSYFVDSLAIIDIRSMIGVLAEMVSEVRLHEISLADFEAHLRETPIILFTLASAVMVVWIFSVSEIEESLK